ncbi:MAG: hypothetical protein IIB55_07060 [Planctomycetes bacterium]|nr:hypothetical protein [Planctomycetota bacterium]
MARSSLRRYDVQATYALGASLFSVVPLIVAVVLLLRNWDPNLGAVVYGFKGKFLPILGVCVALAGVTGAVGVVMGLNSAGQRRNDKERRSWIGFFLGGAVVTGSIIVGIAFLMLRFTV